MFPRIHRFNSATVDVSKIQVEDTADFALKLFSTLDLLRKNRKAGESKPIFAVCVKHHATASVKLAHVPDLVQKMASRFA